MSQLSHHFYEFGPFRLDPVEQMLLHNGREVPLPLKIFDILLLLVRNHGHLLEKSEMIKAIWPDTFVEEGNLTRYISTLRQALGENPNEHRYILTVPKRGYRFVAIVSEVMNDRANQPGSVRPGSEVRSIAVVPFKSLVAEERDETLELGMADALITRLSRFDRMIVRPMSAVRKYSRLDEDAASIGRELMVETVLEGSIQRSDERIRVTVGLVSVKDGAVLWAGQFNEKFTDNFSVQDSISERVAVCLAMKLSG